MNTFEKWQGVGNDFVLMENDGILEDIPNLARKVCDRKLGVGADGLVVIGPSVQADCRMRIFNPDGSEAESCGNALRCVARKIGKTELTIETKSGVIVATLVKDGRVRVAMGAPVGIQDHEGMTLMTMGVPHAVLFVDNFDFDWQGKGKEIENKTDIFPQKTNVDFVQVRDKDTVDLRTWERGAGYTLGCGTGACAAAAAAISKGLTDKKVKVISHGGELEIEQDAEGNLWMSGEAQKVFEGKL